MKKILVLMLAFTLGSVAHAEEVEIQYKRQGQARSAPRPAELIALPSELQIAPDAAVDGTEEEANQTSASELAPVAGSGRLKPVDPTTGQAPQGDLTPVDQDLARRATEAGRRAAEEVSRRRGRKEYYKVGFYEGMKKGLADQSLGGWDQKDGLRRGSRDPEATRIGTDAGRRAAEEGAWRSAEDEVRLQFEVLDREPRFRPRPSRPQTIPSVDIDLPEPKLEDLFHVHPVAASAPLVGFFGRHFGGWAPDAAKLASCPSWQQCFDQSWREPRRAFEEWTADRRESAAYRRLGTRQERETFQQIFQSSFNRSIERQFADHLQWGWEHGLDDGWDYGAFLNAEIAFQSGYHEGFSSEVEEAHRSAFLAEWEQNYDEAYGRTFEDWSRNPKLEIREITVEDGDKDGVFEPGEEIMIAVEVVNFGGGDARTEAKIVGHDLAAPGSQPVRLPARKVTRVLPGLMSRLAETAVVRSDAQMELQIDEVIRPVTVWVSRPFEFKGEVRAAKIEPIDGRATLEVSLANTSRRRVGARVTLDPGNGRSRKQTFEVEPMEPGVTRQVTVDVDSMQPLEVLAGETGVELRVYKEGVEQDRREFRFPALGLDLQNRDLIFYLRHLATEGGSERDVAAAQQLFLKRLEEDWERAIEASGNPYKKDLKKGGTRTTVGDLVAVWKQLSSPSQPAVFVDLGRQIVGRSDNLRGNHPLLRKHLRRLAGTIR